MRSRPGLGKLAASWLCLVAVAAAEPTGRELLARAEARNHLGMWTDRTRLVTLESLSAGPSRVTREARVYERTDPRGAHTTLIAFLAPDDVRGTRLLHVSRRGIPDEYWIWQPATRRVRRLGGNAGGSAHRDELFVGNDMSYRDLELVVRILQWNDVDATVVVEGDDPCGENRCDRLSLTPAGRNEFPFASYRLWLDRHDLLLRRVELIDAGGRVEKRLTFEDYFPTGPYMTPRISLIEHPSTGARSRITTEEVAYDTGLDAHRFTVSALAEAD